MLTLHVDVNSVTTRANAVAHEMQEVPGTLARGTLLDAIRVCPLYNTKLTFARASSTWTLQRNP